MLLKRIACAVPAQTRERFAEAQTAWSALKGTAGFVAQIGGWRADDGHEAVMLGFWCDGASYDSFMQNVHDDIFNRSRQADTYTHMIVTRFDVGIAMDGAAPGLRDAIARAGFVRIAECDVRGERRDHFTECQRRIWDPAMRDAGMLRGEFAVGVDEPNHFLVCSFWPDESTHARYAETSVPQLRERADVDLDCTSVTGRSFIIEPAWVVLGAEPAGARAR
jgi:quinol monooxygenase YgiN